MEEKIRVMIGAAEIDERLTVLANQIKHDFQGETITMICILKGAVFFMVDLAKKLDQPVEFDFMDISSYGDATESSGIIRINKDLENPITGKNVVLVEDIIDTGQTLAHVIQHLKSQNPNTFKICTLLDKPDRRIAKEVTVDYCGFVIPDAFVVGYGLDYAQKYRNLPYIGIIDFQE